MGTTHFSGLSVRAGSRSWRNDAPASTGDLTITGLATGDTLLAAIGMRARARGTTHELATITMVSIAPSAMTISAANTVKLKGTAAYSRYAFTVLYLDADAT